MNNRPGQYAEIVLGNPLPQRTEPLPPQIDEWWVLWVYASDGGLVGWFCHPNKEAVVEKQREVEGDLTFGRKPARTRLECYRRAAETSP